MSIAGKGMQVEMTILRELYQSQKDKCCMFSFLYASQTLWRHRITCTDDLYVEVKLSEQQGE